MRKRKDYTNKTYGKLTILNDEEDYIVPSGYKYRMVSCLCECGNTTTTRLEDVKRGRTRSCGCSAFVNALTPESRSKLSKKLFKEGKFPHLRQGRNEDEFTKFRYILKSTKNSKRSKKDNTLTLQDVKEVWERQGGKCVYTGIELMLPTHTERLTATPSYRKASIDRVDSSKGYDKDNIQIISVTMNYAKNNMSHEEVMEFLDTITLHRSHKDRV